MRALHIGLRVTDLERSLTFYTGLGYDVVGTVPATEHGRLTMLKLPGDEFVSLELVHVPDRGTVDPGGLNHLVVQVDSVHGVVDALAGQGIQAEPPGSPDGSDDFWTAWLTDPDGYRIELVQWPAGHPEGMTGADFAEDPGSSDRPEARTPAETVVAFQEALARHDDSAFALVAEDLVQHAAGPQGREGLRQTLATLAHDLDRPAATIHRVVAQDDLVVVQLTVHGRHVASTMPLLAGTPPTGGDIAWDFIHIWRVVDGSMVEHWACRDDVGLLAQVGGWPPSR